jgi:hypothetical protein
MASQAKHLGVCVLFVLLSKLFEHWIEPNIVLT